MLDSGKLNFLQAFKVSGIICGYLIGSGFSSGQEILQYFVSYGLWGVGTAIVAGITLMFMAVWLLTLGKREDIKNPHEVFKYYCGAKVGAIFEFTAFTYLIIQVVVFFTGAGATISEAFNVSTFVGSIILGGVVIFTVLLGLNKLAIIMGNVGIFLIITVISLVTIFLFRNPAGVVEGSNLVQNMDILQPSSSWILSGFLYETFNLLGIAAFLPLLGAKAASQKDNIFAGILGPILLSTTIILVTLSFLTDITNVGTKLIPMLYVAKSVAPLIGTFFSLIILMAIYSGASPMFWNFCARIVPESSSKFKPFVFILGAAAIVFGAILPFDKAINIVYLAYGYLGTIFLAFIIVKEVRRKLNK